MTIKKNRYSIKIFWDFQITSASKIQNEFAIGVALMPASWCIKDLTTDVGG